MEKFTEAAGQPGWKNKVSREKNHIGYGNVSYGDSWSLDMTLARIIGEHLHAFLKAEKGPNGGCPGSVISMYGEDRGPAEWLNIIRKMIYAFEEYQRFPTGYSIEEQDPEKYGRIKEGMQLFIDHYRDLWI